MKVLCACEESQAVCLAFRERGHLAFSCDLLPCSGGFPEWHIQDDVFNILYDDWDLVLAFPPCLWLNKLPPLCPTFHVLDYHSKSGTTSFGHCGLTRSKTFPGVARAMASQ